MIALTRSSCGHVFAPCGALEDARSPMAFIISDSDLCRVVLRGAPTASPPWNFVFEYASHGALEGTSTIIMTVQLLFVQPRRRYRYHSMVP